MSHELLERHRKTLDNAVAAIHDRGYFSAYPEVPSGKIYGESAKDEGIAAFKSRLNEPFTFANPPQGGDQSAGASEVSPYGFPLGITYPSMDVDTAVAAAKSAMRNWAKADIDTRVGICLEILHRLNKRSFEIACAVMHTTGQGFMMAFQAGGPHAQDRGLEAVAYAYEEMKRHPQRATWRKQVSKTDFVTLEKTFHIVPRGVSAVIACSTFPTWNSYPAMFASFATGNAVIVKPHPGAILPLAITVDVMREVLGENGFDPNVATLLADTVDNPVTKDLVTHGDVRIVDYTGGSDFGDWIEDNAKQAAVYTEKAGVNCVIIDSIGSGGDTNLKAVTGNLAFTVSLYSGQMCTTSQNIFIPRDGIEVDGEHKSFDEVAQALVGAVNWFLGDPARAAEVLGAIQNEHTARRVEQAAAEVARASSPREAGQVLRQSDSITNEQFPEARTRSPLILKVDAADRHLYMREMFGPIVYLVATDSTEQSIDLAREAAQTLGAITCAVYSTRDDVLANVEETMTNVGVPVSCNLTGQIFVNQSAAFSDFHVSGLNPSGNATLTDGAYVSNRFRVVQSRVPVKAEADVESKPEVAQAKA